MRLPLRLLAAAVLARPALAGVTVVPTITSPLTPSPVIAQLALDMSALSPSGAVPTLVGAPLSPSPSAWANMSFLVKGVPAAAVPESVKPSLGAKPAAAERLAFAQNVLGRFEPAKFAEMSDAERDAKLEELWDGWKARGLVPGGPDALDRAILAAVEDKELTSASKSTFLGVAVLGYPLQDSLWLQRTRIDDALDENALHYPAGQQWMDRSGTPEFLGTTKRAQELVNAWGAATEHGKAVVAAVRAGTPIPKTDAVPKRASAAFARLAEELKAAGDEEALAYLSGQDPTFSAFLLDARKPGYYLYNGDKGVIARIMKAKAAADMGIRRVEHPVPGLTISSSYFYRPRRVVERLKELDGEPGGEHSSREKELLQSYIPKLSPLLP